MATGEAAVRDLLVKVAEGRDTEIIDLWVRAQLDHTATGGGLAESDLRVEAEEVLRALLDGVRDELALADVVDHHQPLRVAVVQLSLRRAKTGVAPTATAMAVLGLKDAVLSAVESETDDPRMLFDAARLINRLLDAAGVLTFAAYVEGREEIIRTQHQQMLELSTPVVRLWPSVLAVPLIGTLDSSRTQLVMNGLLQAIQDNEALVAIIDITGVPTVDTVVAHHLLQTVSAVRLMGADCFISGIRPVIAQTITQLGIDLSTITTRATLADALAEAIRLLDTDAPAHQLSRARSES